MALVLRLPSQCRHLPRSVMPYLTSEHTSDSTLPEASDRHIVHARERKDDVGYRTVSNAATVAGSEATHRALPRSPTTCGQNSAAGSFDVGDEILLTRRLITRLMHHAPKLESSVFDQTLHFLPAPLRQSVRSHSHRHKLESPM